MKENEIKQKSNDDNNKIEKLIINLEQDQIKNINFPHILAPNILTKEFKQIDCNQNVTCLQWKPKNENNPSDKNKFIIYTNQG